MPERGAYHTGGDGLTLSAGISYSAMYYLGLQHIKQCYDVVYQYLHNVDTRWLGDVIEISGQATEEK